MYSDRSVVLALDRSGSMSGTPISETKEAAHLFVTSVLEQNAVTSVVAYSDVANVTCNFTASESVLGSAIDGINANGRTNIHDALSAAENLLDGEKSEQKIIVLMTDGMPNDGLCGDDLVAYADTLKEKGIVIYTLGFFQDLGSSDKYEAQQLLERIASDGCHIEVSTAEDLQFFFNDVADQVNGQRYYYIKIEAPVEVTVSHGEETLTTEEDELCTRSSFGALSFENSEEGEENYVRILRLKEGPKYNIHIEAKEKCRVDYTIAFMDESGKYSDFRSFENIKLSKRAEIDTVAQSSDETRLSVDSDGDGKYDTEYVATANGKAQPVDKTLDYIVMGVGAASAVGVLISFTVMLIRIRRRKALR